MTAIENHRADISQTGPVSKNRHLPLSAALGWLKAGWRDLIRRPGPSLAYGAGVLIASLIVIAAIIRAGWGHVLFPALAGFMIVGPLVAIGLYEKSRLLETGCEASFNDMAFARAKAGGQVLFIGAILSLLMVFWMRAAVLIYALFFGLRPFPGLDEIVPMLFTTPVGWAMLFVGSVIGALFAAFSFAISVLAIPMLLDRPVDAFTAMGTSMAHVWANLPVMLAWGTIALALFLLSLLTGLLGLVVIFPLLGHATWHAYRAMEIGG
jgi:uncharacterized membrane protein